MTRKMTKAKADECEALCALVKPWLPDATVETLNVQECCGCYSEWSQEPPVYEVTFRATHNNEQALSKLVSAIEPLVMRFATARHLFTGCPSCCGEDGNTNDVWPSLWVRVIPINSRRRSTDHP